MPAIATLLKQLRSQHNGPCLTLDIGDHIDRAHLVADGTQGAANVAVMNKTGYDYFVPGNNEGLALRHEQMAHLFGELATFKTLGTNIFELHSGKRPTWCLPMEIVQIEGKRLALFGLTASLTKYYRLLGWDVRNPIEMMQVAMEDIRGQVDAVIVMSHLGIELDRKLANEVNGITCIIGGHTHHLFTEAEWVNQTAICCAGKFGQYVGVVTLDFHADYLSVDAKVIETKEVEEDQAIRALISQFHLVAEENLNDRVAFLRDAIPHHYHEDSVLGNVMAQAICEKTGADLALVNNGLFFSGLDAGEVSKKTLLTICPSPIQICKMKLKGYQIVQTLEQSLLEQFQQFRFQGFGFRGDVLGGLSVDGLSITYDAGGEDLLKIKTVHVHGRPLDLDAEYVVGTLDLFTFGVGYKVLQEGKELEYFLPSIIRDELARVLQNESFIQRAFKKRWHTT
jgi:2',3'-cyclic-nucleotide 2'-phosphodiesterase (5'-nucleotidase family)